MNTQATYRTVNEVPAAIRAEWIRTGAARTVGLVAFANTRAEKLAAMWFNRRDNRTH